MPLRLLLWQSVGPEAVRGGGLLLMADLLEGEVFSGIVEGKLYHYLKTFCHKMMAVLLILSHDSLSLGLSYLFYPYYRSFFIYVLN